jgi:hypothetical protein
MPTAKTSLSPALLLAALLIGAAGVALGMAVDRGSASRTPGTGSASGWSATAGPASSPTPPAPWTISISTHSPAEASLVAGQATIITMLETPVPTVAPPTATPAPYRSPTPTPTGANGGVRVGER